VVCVVGRAVGDVPGRRSYDLPGERVVVADGVVGQPRADRGARGDHKGRATDLGGGRGAGAGEGDARHGVTVDQLAHAGDELGAGEGDRVAVGLGAVVGGDVEGLRIDGQPGERVVVADGVVGQPRADRGARGDNKGRATDLGGGRGAGAGEGDARHGVTVDQLAHAGDELGAGERNSTGLDPGAVGGVYVVV